MNKQKKKTLITWVISIGIGAIVGFIIGIGASAIDIPPQYTILPFYVNIPIVIVTYLLAVALHELGHAYSFSKNGIKVRAVIITSFLFMKEQGRWRFQFKPNGVTAIGGIAVPDVDSVKDDDDFRMKQASFAKAIIAGPIASLILWVVGAFAGIIIILLSSNVYVQSGFFTFLVSLTLITLFLLGTSFIKNDIAIGDFPAYKMMKHDRFFVAMQLYQYAIFSSEHERVRRENVFLQELILEELEKKLETKDTHIYTLSVVDSLLVEFLIGRQKELPQVVKEYLEFIVDDPKALSKVKSSELTLIIYSHILRWLNEDEAFKMKALELYDEIKNDIKPNTMIRKYVLRQAEHVLGLADHSEFLQDKRNICYSPAHGIWKNFEGYFVDELALNQRTPKEKAL
ncbi:M50 family metallopeptidase [Bacillus alkalicellulosilyticus]|uniref:M50 family metallopeptidase n=1 Tax=Alkalihalobacterium alkalicellulosilyticum TaxID=1912214 RepID=UPI00099767CF|nr:M50 family metallopeptidase [Bacillus alkalicellulosilyticus]